MDLILEEEQAQKALMAFLFHIQMQGVEWMDVIVEVKKRGLCLHREIVENQQREFGAD